MRGVSMLMPPLVVIALSCFLVQTSGQPDWFEKVFCKNETRDGGSKLFHCLPRLQKIYVFNSDLKNYYGAKAYCEHAFPPYSNSQLVDLESCEEYEDISKAISNYIQQEKHRFPPLNEYRIAIWTSGNDQLPGDVSDDNGNKSRKISLDKMCPNGTNTVDNSTLENTSTTDSGLGNEPAAINIETIHLERRDLLKSMKKMVLCQLSYEPNEDWNNYHYFNRSRSEEFLYNNPVIKAMNEFKKIFNEIIDSVQSNNEKLNTIDNLVDNTTLWESPNKNLTSHMSDWFLAMTHHLSFNMSCQNETQEHYGKNIRIQTFDRNQVLKSGFTFPFKLMQNDSQEGGIQFSSDVPVQQSQCGKYIATGIIFKNIGVHMVGPNAMNGTNNTITMNSNIIAFSLGPNRTLHPLPDGSKVTIYLPHLKHLPIKSQSKCVFWDTEAMEWNSSGCALVSFTRTYTICECDHLTNFAVLMDISGTQELSYWKDLMTKICSGFSVVGLIFTIFFFSICKPIKSKRSFMTVNLSICLLLVNLLIMFGFERNDNLITCRVLSGVLVYSLLSAFAWMLIQGYFLYKMVILVFESVGHLSNWMLLILGYIPSALILLTYVVVTGWKGLYDPTHGFYCWISNAQHPENIWVIAGPGTVIAVINIIILIITFRKAINSHCQNLIGSSGESLPNKTQLQLERKKIHNWIKGWTSLVVLVGATWITGALMAHDKMDVSGYIFIILNGLQGFYIFLFEIVLNGKTRKAIIRYFVPKQFMETSCTKLMTQKGKTYSTSNDTRKTSDIQMNTSGTPGSQ